MTPEGKVKNKVKKLLDHMRLVEEQGVWQHWPVQAGYGKPCLDCHVCYNGLYLAIETKAPGKKPTARQECTISDIDEADGKVIVIGERETDDGFHYSGMKELSDWLVEHARR
jgi:hypothetical protein